MHRNVSCRKVSEKKKTTAFLFQKYWKILTLILAVFILTAGCAEFLEDYQYNPAGPLYQTFDNGSNPGGSGSSNF